MNDENKTIAAEILLQTKAVLLRPEQPFILTSGRKSPVYVDCRRLISFVEARNKLMSMGVELLQEKGVIDEIDIVAGGETAGIPYAAFISDRLRKPMVYIRKKPKGFGRNARIEGVVNKQDKVLLVEDMTTDGGSKLSFVDAIREVKAKCNHCFVIFSYGIFPQKIKELEKKSVKLHSLTDWWSILEYIKKTQYLPNAEITILEEFLNNPEEWSKKQEES